MIGIRYIVPIAASLLIVAAVLCFRHHRSESLEVAEVTLDAPYLRVLAAVGKKSSFESILESGGTRLVDRTWDEFKFDLREMPRLSSWEMRGRGRFKVSSISGDFAGEMEIEQVVSADRDGVSADSRSSSPCGFISKSDTKMTIKNGRPVKLRVESTLVYERHIPFWMADEVDSRVKKHNRERVEAMVDTVESIVSGGHPEKTAHQ